MSRYRKYFVRHLQKNYPNEWPYIVADTERHYKVIAADTAFAKTSRNPIDKRLDFSAYFLALIKTLHHRGEPFEKIRMICLRITTNYVRPKNQLLAFFKRLLPGLIRTWPGKQMIRLLQRRVQGTSHPDGFAANILTDKKETLGLGYGIDITECGICKLFRKHQFAGYASILCEVDEITSSLAGLQLIRNGTIAKGAEKCDFRFLRKEKVPQPVKELH